MDPTLIISLDPKHYIKYIIFKYSQIEIMSFNI